MSLDALAPNELAAVVTYLEMRSPPAPSAAASDLQAVRATNLSPADYRSLFRAVGARWLWFSRLLLDDEALAAIIHDPAVELYRIQAPNGAEVGLLELDFRQAAECELAFVGLVPSHTGQGHGAWLLAEALRRAWRPMVTRVHVHTCSLDHPAALKTYLRAGFTPVGRAVERFADPRLAGVLPPDCAPQVPLFGTPLTVRR